MKILNEIFKALAIIQLIFKSFFLAIFTKDQESKNLLTQLYLHGLYSKSKLKMVTIDSRIEEQVLISTYQLSQDSIKAEDRFTLQSPKELNALLWLLKKQNPIKVFEFGVMRGGSLYHFFLNTKDNTQIYSLDINFSNIYPVVLNVIKNNPRLKLIEGDSTLFDESIYKNSIDFIFIDGGHDYKTVKSDTQKALTMLTKNGTIVWDDYSPHFPGVYNFLNNFTFHNSELFHVKGTSLVYLQLKS